MILLQAKNIDPNEFMFIIAITVAMLLVIAFFSVYLFFLFQKRKTKLIMEQQEQKEMYEKEMLKTQIEIRDQTMKDVGRELHDHIGQVLTVIKLNLNQLNTANLETKTAERLGTTKDLVSDVIQDLRNLGKTLSADMIGRMGLVESIGHELNRINKIDLITCNLEVEGEPYEMPSENEFVVFRIVQENLNNILKHSKSRNVLTKLIYGEQNFTLIQKDDGRGFDMEEVNNRSLNNSGSGLINMQKRAQLVDAHLQIESEIGKGSQITLHIKTNPKFI